jgi:N-formylglutamate amidohydrolase
MTAVPAYCLTRPPAQTTSVVFSSPHSGRDYPAGFVAGSALGAAELRSSEDAFVDDLFSTAPAHGAPLLSARLPRAYVDLNRAPDEFDSALIEGAPRFAHNPRVSSGLGVIPRVVAAGRAIYFGKMSLAEAEARIDAVWHPFHHALRALMAETHARFGEAILIDCHSMPHAAIEAHARPGQPMGQPLPEVVLGDRYGAAAAPGIIDRVEAAFRGAGFRTIRNSPFAGAYIAQAYGRPSARHHVVQVEIDRALYMDEARVRPRPDFDAFRARLRPVVAELAAIGGGNALPLAAE